jgi:hypothetical protein
MDIFRPHTEPAGTIYDAFQEEANKRSSRSVEKWILKERIAVWNAAIEYSSLYNLYIPNIQDVEKTEKEAYGSVDYGSKWSIKLANLIMEKSNGS